MTKPLLSCLTVLALGIAATAAAQTVSPPDSTSNPDGLGSPSLADPRPVDARNAVTLKAGDVPAPLGSVAPNVQPNVTVHGRELRQPCGPRDKACIQAVTAEIWRRYPKVIEQLCTREEIYKFQEGFVMDDLGVEGVTNGRMSPQTQALCAYGAQMKKGAKAAAAAPPPTPAAGSP